MFSCFYKPATILTQPNYPVHLIWIGSPLREKDIKALSRWKKLNPDNEICVWIESQYDAVVRKQLAGIDVTIAHLSTLKIPDTVKNSIDKFIKKFANLPPNPAAASDIFRFYILDQIGGWYFDFDITPFVVAKTKIDPKYNFFTSYPTGDSATSLTPDVLLAHPKSLWTQNAIAYIEAAAPIFAEDKHVALIRSQIASVRLAATENSTGNILSAVVSTILKRGYPIYDGSERIKIRNKKVFRQITREFDESCENSWIKRPDIIQDRDYLFGRLVQDDNVIKDIVSMINKIKTKALSVVTKNHADTLHTNNSLKIFKAAIKKTTSFEAKLVDCISEYMWASTDFQKMGPIKTSTLAIAEEKEEPVILPKVCTIGKHKNSV